ncbi:MAG: RDD family protein [Acidimicrobiales bacterium]
MPPPPAATDRVTRFVWRRILAWLLDGALVAGAIAAVSSTVGFGDAARWVAAAALAIVGEAVVVARFGATPGKLVVGLRVVGLRVVGQQGDIDGQGGGRGTPSWVASLRRALVKNLPTLVMAVGWAATAAGADPDDLAPAVFGGAQLAVVGLFVSVLLDGRGRGWHDRFGATGVAASRGSRLTARSAVGAFVR